MWCSEIAPGFHLVQGIGNAPAFYAGSYSTAHLNGFTMTCNGSGAYTSGTMAFITQFRLEYLDNGYARMSYMCGSIKRDE